MSNDTKNTVKTRGAQMSISAKKRKKKQRRREMFLIFLALVIVSAVIGILASTVLFRTGEITVENEAIRYTDEDIIAVSGIQTGKSMLTFTKNKAESKIEKQLPYIGKATVKRQLSGTVTITVEYTKANMAMKAGSGWVLLNAEGKVLETGVRDLPDYIAEVIGVTPTAFNIGETVTATDESVLSALLDLTTAMEKYGYTNVTAYDLSDLNQVSLEIDYAISVKLGSIGNAVDKLQFGKAVIDKNMNTAFEGTLVVDLTDEGKAYVRKDTDAGTEPAGDESSTVLELTEPSELAPVG